MKKWVLQILVISIAATISISLTAEMPLAENLPNEWTPSWQVGDWWIVKQIQRRVEVVSRPGPEWSPYPSFWRFEIVGMEDIGDTSCYVMEMRAWPPDSTMPEARRVYYLQRDNLQVLRMKNYSYDYIGGHLLEPWILNYKYKQKSPFLPQATNEPAVPAFPLAYEGPRAKEHSEPRRGPSPYIAYVAQNVSVRSLLDFRQQISDGGMDVSFDKDCYYVVIETIPYDKLVELGLKEKRRHSWTRAEYFSRQLWIPSLPWCVYEEQGYIPQEGKKKVWLRRWLIDSSWESR
ncbi:MAG: hypothetical protein ACE5NG_17690 [bacterium]